VTTITAILTSHNRCESTIECLACLERAGTVGTVTIATVLVDDDSIDGTAYAVANRFPWVQIVKGNRGTVLEQRHALRYGGRHAHV
jgi:GT2 family glycosyltransferase